MKDRIELLLIDPQNDFCDLPDALLAPTLGGGVQRPALPVKGAHADMMRAAEFIDRAGASLSGITVTLDSHQRLDIAHPTFWKTGEGSAVTPFTQITAAEVRAGRYAPRDSASRERALAYLDELERLGRYTLMVWPVHCEIGSWGHDVHAAVRAACNRWEEQRLENVHFIAKGSNPWTEHYSALQAEVPDAGDPGTQLNRELLAHLDRAAQIVIAGEASSHCVRATTEHIADHLPSGRVDKLVLLADCISPVTGFESQARAFLDDMRRRGATVTTGAEYRSSLVASA